jgi:2',3'-cyclic-nucleotide 2'-phosphodiesterase/3'-nucleotidase
MPILLDRRAFLATTAGFIAMHPFAQAGQAHLRIMETTDIHVHVFPTTITATARSTPWASPAPHR